MPYLATSVYVLTSLLLSVDSNIIVISNDGNGPIAASRLLSPRFVMDSGMMGRLSGYMV